MLASARVCTNLLNRGADDSSIYKTSDVLFLGKSTKKSSSDRPKGLLSYESTPLETPAKIKFDEKQYIATGSRHLIGATHRQTRLRAPTTGPPRDPSEAGRVGKRTSKGMKRNFHT